MSDFSHKDIIERIDNLSLNIEKRYVTKDEFRPVKTVVYGLVSLILLTVATAIVASVVKAGI